jgi:hypothetical protein
MSIGIVMTLVVYEEVLMMRSQLLIEVCLILFQFDGGKMSEVVETL